MNSSDISSIEQRSAQSEPGSERRSSLIYDLTATFRALMWQANKHGAAVMERLGLTLPQAVALWTLDACGGRGTMSEIAGLTYQSAATVTGIVDRLADAGLVTRERDSEDRRVVYVLITEAGRAKLGEIHAKRRRQMEKMAAALSDNEIEQLNSIMLKLIAGAE
jgi:DNA-binding MarR family transcriptional regulator